MNRNRWAPVAVAGFSFLALTARAQADDGKSAADILMQSVAPGASIGVADAMNPGSSEFKLSDPFLASFFAEWRAEKALPYEVGLWATGMLKGEYEHSAHVWSAIEGQIPASFRIAAESAHLYSLWKLGLSQLFFDSWVRQLADSSFVSSRSAFALNDAIQGGSASSSASASAPSSSLGAWMLDQSPSLRAEQESTIAGLPVSSPVYITLRAYASLRHGDKAAAVLPMLSASHPMKLQLSQAATLAFAQKGDLASAARILKAHAEPALEAKHDASALPSHLLQVARLLYQAGALNEAEQYYSRVPRSAPEFLKAREELTWVWLRKGDSEKMRGELKSLSGSLLEERFQPEAYVVRAISNLKLCQYEAVERDFQDFKRLYGTQASLIDQALKKDEPEAVRDLDFASKQAARRVSLREAELASIEELHRRSVAASLPAIGFQSQWVKAKAQLASHVEEAKKLRTAEYRRQWRNHQALLSEAIKKMQFVKLELLSQVREAQTQLGAASGDSLRLTSAAPEREFRGGAGSMKAAESTGPKASSDSMVFPVDSSFWPDELFHLRSVAQGRCLRR